MYEVTLRSFEKVRKYNFSEIVVVGFFSISFLWLMECIMRQSRLVAFICMSFSCLVADAPGVGTSDVAQLTHCQDAQRSHCVPVGQPSFRGGGGWSSMNPSLVPLLFLYFFPQLKTKRFTFFQASPGVGGAGPQGRTGRTLSGVVQRPSLWLQVIIQKGKASQAIGFVTWNTRDKPADPSPFVFIPVQVGKKKESLSVALSSRNGTPLWVYLHFRPASASSQRQPHRTDKKHVPKQGILSCPAKSPLHQHQSPPFPKSLRNCILFACLIPTGPPPGPVR